MRCLSVFAAAAAATLLVVITIDGVLATPVSHWHREVHPQDAALGLALPRDMAAWPHAASVSNGGRKKKYKKFLIHSFWNLMYYYAWFVGIVIIKFKAVLLFLLGNLTFFVVALIRVLIKEVPMWNYLKKAAPSSPSPVYGPPPSQYKYGPPSYEYAHPATNYGPPSPTYGTPTNYDTSYSDGGLYKRQGGNQVTNNAHDIAYSGQRK